MSEDLDRIVTVVLFIVLFTLDDMLFSREIAPEAWQWKQHLNRRKRARSGVYYS